MRWISEISWCIYLILIAVHDYKKKYITQNMVCFGISISVSLACIQGELPDGIGRMLLIGGCLFWCSYISKEMLGYGDVIVMGMMSLTMDLMGMLTIMWLAFTLSFVVGVSLYVRKKVSVKQGLPFLPFLAMAYIAYKIWILLLV